MAGAIAQRERLLFGTLNKCAAVFPDRLARDTHAHFWRSEDRVRTSGAEIRDEVSKSIGVQHVPQQGVLLPLRLRKGQPYQRFRINWRSCRIQQDTTSEMSRGGCKDVAAMKRRTQCRQVVQRLIQHDRALHGRIRKHVAKETVIRTNEEPAASPQRHWTPACPHARIYHAQKNGPHWE